MAMEAVKTWARRLLGTNFILPFVSGRRYVILFHDVSEPAERHHNGDAAVGVWPYSYRPDEFLALVEMLGQLFELVSLDAIVSADPGRRRKNFATITFDDGYSSVATTALPMLKAKGIPCSVFLNKQAVIENRLGSTTKVMLRKGLKAADEEVLQALYDRCAPESRPADYQAFRKAPLQYVDEARMIDDAAFVQAAGFARRHVYLDEAAVRQLVRQGVIMGNHTVSHPNLTSCDEAALRYEIGENKRYVSELVGAAVRHFAIPFGGERTFTSRAVDICRELGHPYIYSTTPTSFRYADLAGAQSTIPRYCIYKPVPRDFMFYINRPFFLTSNQ